MERVKKIEHADLWMCDFPKSESLRVALFRQPDQPHQQRPDSLKPFLGTFVKLGNLPFFFREQQVFHPAKGGQFVEVIEYRR